jgi:hypothetical protein
LGAISCTSSGSQRVYRLADIVSGAGQETVLDLHRFQRSLGLARQGFDQLVVAVLQLEVLAVGHVQPLAGLPQQLPEDQQQRDDPVLVVRTAELQVDNDAPQNHAQRGERQGIQVGAQRIQAAGQAVDREHGHPGEHQPADELFGKRGTVEEQPGGQAPHYRADRPQDAVAGEKSHMFGGALGDHPAHVLAQDREACRGDGQGRQHPKTQHGPGPVVIKNAHEDRDEKERDQLRGVGGPQQVAHQFGIDPLGLGGVGDCGRDVRLHGPRV